MIFNARTPQDARVARRGRVWVTGATGFVGRHVVRELLARGDDVTVLVRPSSVGRLAVPAERVRVVRTGLPAPEGIFAEIGRPDAIVHLAAILARGGAVARREYDSIHVDATAQLARYAHLAGARFVHLSSISVVGCRDVPFVADESTPCAPTCLYGVTKLAGEDAVRKHCDDHVILRPPGISGDFSPDDIAQDLARKVARGHVVNVDDWPVSLLHVENAVAAILGVGLDPRVRGETFFVDDGAALRMGDIARAMGRALGVEARVVPRGVRQDVVRYARGRALGALRASVRGRAAVSSMLPAPIVHPSVRIAKITRAGYAPVVGLEEGCARFVRWAREAGRL